DPARVARRVDLPARRRAPAGGRRRRGGAHAVSVSPGVVAARERREVRPSAAPRRRAAARARRRDARPPRRRPLASAPARGRLPPDRRGPVGVGGERYARERGTVGLATLRVRHVEISGSVVTLAFPGKSGERWERAIEDPDLAALVAELTDRGPRSHLLSWRDDDGWYPLHSADITADVRERTGLDATAKDLRTLRGTAIAARSLAKAGPAHTDTERRSALAQAACDAADALGNTPSVARSSYIDPRVADRFERGAVVDPG